MTLLRDKRASSAAEFALVLPLLLIFLLGIIDVGRLLWTFNRMEKATQMGARFAVVTNPVASELKNFSAVGKTDKDGNALVAGDSLANYEMATATYTGTGGTGAPSCSGNCSALGQASTSAFDAIYNRMQNFVGELPRTGVVVSYSNSGLGYAGDPNGADLSPIVTVSIQNMVFKPISLALFKANFTLRTISAALTMEDGQGTVSN